MPPPVRPGDRLRLVSPASPPERDAVLQQAAILESWGLKVEFGRHVFDRHGYLAGRDEDRLSDLNDALRDPDVRAIVATRGGKGAYRIADQLDFDAVRNDPKLLVGFSDITILHLSLWKHCRLAGLHGALSANESGEPLREAMMGESDIVVAAMAGETTAELVSAHGVVSGPLLGGNLSMIATAAGWALPDLAGAILLLEAVDLPLGQIDRDLTRLRKGGWLSGLAGIAIGRFERCKPQHGVTVIDILRDHILSLDVPVLGGLPLGHGVAALPVMLGLPSSLDPVSGRLTIRRSG
jgi:muramoyltetrapeptide carboxypeptidase